MYIINSLAGMYFAMIWWLIAFWVPGFPDMDLLPGFLFCHQGPTTCPRTKIKSRNLDICIGSSHSLTSTSSHSRCPILVTFGLLCYDNSGEQHLCRSIWLCRGWLCVFLDTQPLFVSSQMWALNHLREIPHILFRLVPKDLWNWCRNVRFWG